jgi:hypothetical protein
MMGRHHQDSRNTDQRDERDRSSRRRDERDKRARPWTGKFEAHKKEREEKQKFSSNSSKQLKKGKDRELPPELPKDKWRKDDKGRLMKRKCSFCQKWHMDYDCPLRPASYNLTTMTTDQMGSSSDDDADVEMQEASSSSASESSPSSDNNEEKGAGWRPSKARNMIYHNVYTDVSPGKSEQLTIPRASQYRIEEMPMAFSVGTGVSYLSAQPCPIKACVGVQPEANQPLQDGVTDTGASCIIDEKMVPPRFPIMKSPLKPVFQSIGNGQTPVKGYVVLPVHLPNAAAMSGDDRHARVAKIWMEFQVVENCPARFLIGMDALKAYKWSIDLPSMTITLKGYNPPIKIPITETKCFTTKKVDPRVFAAEAINIQPYHELWIPVRFKVTDNYSDLMVTPVRYANVAEGTYATCSYAIMSKDTNHLLMINPTERPFQIKKDEVVGMFEPVVANTPFAYFSSSVSNISPSPPPPMALSSNTTTTIPMSSVPIVVPDLNTTNWESKAETTTDIFPDITQSLGLNDPHLTWRDRVGVPIDPFGLENEFKETGPLVDNPSPEILKVPAKDKSSADN